MLFRSAILENYAKEMMNNKDQVRGMLERVLENKVFELVKGLVRSVESVGGSLGDSLSW